MCGGRNVYIHALHMANSCLKLAFNHNGLHNMKVTEYIQSSQQLGEVDVSLPILPMRKLKPKEVGRFFQRVHGSEQEHRLGTLFKCRVFGVGIKFFANSQGETLCQTPSTGAWQ